MNPLHVCGITYNENHSCSNIEKCCNCGQNHRASSKLCPVYLQEKEIVNIVHSEKIGFSAARARVIPPSRSYVKAVATSIVNSSPQREKIPVKEKSFIPIKESSNLTRKIDIDGQPCSSNAKKNVSKEQTTTTAPNTSVRHSLIPSQIRPPNHNKEQKSFNSPSNKTPRYAHKQELQKSSKNGKKQQDATLPSRENSMKGQRSNKAHENKTEKSSIHSNKETSAITKRKNSISKNDDKESKRETMPKEKSGSRNSTDDLVKENAPDEINGAKPKKRIRPEENIVFNSYSVLTDMEEDIPSSYVFERGIPRLKR